MVRRVDLLVSLQDTIEDIKTNVEILRNKRKLFGELFTSQFDDEIDRLKDSVKNLESEVKYLLDLYQQLNKEVTVE